MKLLRGEPTPEMKAAIADCVAHRCARHQDIPPMNMAEGNGSSECGGCVAESMGTEFAEQALAIQELRVLFPILDGYADRLEHHARLVAALRRAQVLMRLASLDAGFINEVLDGGL